MVVRNCFRLLPFGLPRGLRSSRDHGTRAGILICLEHFPFPIYSSFQDELLYIDTFHSLRNTHSYYHFTIKTTLWNEKVISVATGDMLLSKATSPTEIYRHFRFLIQVFNGKDCQTGDLETSRQMKNMQGKNTNIYDDLFETVT